jgi:hypothetical protein
MSKENIIEKLKTEIGEDEDLFDFEAEWDNTLTDGENYNILKEKIKPLIQDRIKEVKQELENPKNTADGLNFKNSYMEKRQNEIFKNIHNKKIILVYGITRSGKTALSYKLIEHIKKFKPIYIYKHPLPSAIKELGFNYLKSINQLSGLLDCCVYIDEPQFYFPREDKKNNDFLQKLFTIAGQRNLTLIFSTSDSRWVNKKTEEFVESWFIKDCEPYLIKNGSKIKYIIKENNLFGLSDFKLNKEEFLFYDRGEDLEGKFKFNLPSFWNENILSVPYRNI